MVEQHTDDGTFFKEKTPSPAWVHIVIGIVAVAFSTAFVLSRIWVYEGAFILIPVGAVIYRRRSVLGRLVLFYLSLIYPLLMAQGSRMANPAIQRTYILVLLGSAGFLFWRTFPGLFMHIKSDLRNGKEKIGEKSRSTPKAALLVCIGILFGFFSLARWGNEAWLAARPVGHYLILLLPVAAILGASMSRGHKSEPFDRREKIVPWTALVGGVILLILHVTFYPHDVEQSRETRYSELLREVVAKRDWLLSEEGRRTSYEQKTQTMTELDRRFSEFLHSHPDDGKMWLLRGILTRMRPDAGAKRLDPLCFEEAARHLSPGDGWRIFYPYEERSFFEEAVGRLLELGYVKAANEIVAEAPKTEWGDALRRQVPISAESGYANLDSGRAKKPAEQPPWPVREKIGRTAELIGFAPLGNLGGEDPRGKIQLTGGDVLAFEAWIRFREEATLHPKKVHLSGVQGINLDLPLAPNLEVGGEPWEIARLPIEIALPGFLGPLAYDVSLVFEETWDFPPGPLACPLTVLDVFPRLSREKAPLWKVQQICGNISYLDLGFRTIVAPGKGFHGSLPTPVSAKGLILVSGLSYASGVPLETKVAEIRVEDKDGNSVSLPIRVGIETAEILADNPRGASPRGEAAVWTSYEQKAGEGPETFEAHQYHARIDFQKPMAVSSVGVEATGEKALFLNVFHVLLVRADE